MAELTAEARDRAAVNYQLLVEGDNDAVLAWKWRKQELADYAGAVLRDSWSIVVATPGQFRFSGHAREIIGKRVLSPLFAGRYAEGLLLSRATDLVRLDPPNRTKPVYLTLMDATHRFDTRRDFDEPRIDLLDRPDRHIVSRSFGGPSPRVAWFEHADEITQDGGHSVVIPGVKRMDEAHLAMLNNLLETIEIACAGSEVNRPDILPQLPAVLYQPGLRSTEQVTYDLTIPGQSAQLQALLH